MRSFCIKLVKASAFVVCIGVFGAATSACVVRERTVVQDRHETRRERHYEERHDR